MARLPDPYLLGKGLPELRVTAEQALLLLPAIRAWVVEHERAGSQAKVAEVRGLVERWEYLAALQREAFAVESDASASVDAPAQSPYEISAAQAAERLGVSPQRVGQLLRARDLDGRKVGRVWLVDAASVAAYRRRAA